MVLISNQGNSTIGHWIVLVLKKAIRDMLLNTVYLIEFYMIMSFAGLCVNFKRNHRNLSKWGIL